jgi:hypothetical protein
LLDVFGCVKHPGGLIPPGGFVRPVGRCYSNHAAWATMGARVRRRKSGAFRRLFFCRVGRLVSYALRVTHRLAAVTRFQGNSLSRQEASSMSVGTLLLIILIIVLIGTLPRWPHSRRLGLPTCGWPRTGAGHSAHSCVDGPVVVTCLQDAFRFCMSFKASTYPRT